MIPFEYLKTFESWVSTSTHPLIDDSDPYKIDKELDKKSVIKFINDYRKQYSKGITVRELKAKAKEEFGEELYILLELDSFFKALRVKQKLNSETAESYFDDYISEISRIFLKIEDDYPKYNLSDKFAKLKELKSAKKVQRKVSKRIFEKENQSLFIEVLKMVEWIKDNNKKILITLDGRDSAGKGSFIRLFEENTPEKIVSHEWFDIPTKYQSKNWFSRYIKALPKIGHLKFYDRSWYNRAVNDIVNGYCTEDEYKQFMKDVIPFEKKLIDDDTIYIKMWFSIDKETQEFRFNLRKANPVRYWKFSPNDAKAVEKYDMFTFYKEQMFVKTSTKKSPWVVVNMNDKKLGQLNALRYILNKIPYPNKNEDIIQPFKTIVYEV
jgi:polyphosphate kinase 2 (PPK2 family)/sulfur relay (sulfurtransferase) DsrC/TusE family protein